MTLKSIVTPHFHMDPHQKQSNGRSQDEPGHYVGAVVPVLGDSVEAGEEGRAERAQAQHRLGQAAGLGLDGAGDVHLDGTTKRSIRSVREHSLCPLIFGGDENRGDLVKSNWSPIFYNFVEHKASFAVKERCQKLTSFE